MTQIITRFAPSPTGSLHIGGIRTALYCYALARKSMTGKFILRIEDTDRNRIVEGAKEEIVEMMESYGLIPDEIHEQSQRKEIYQDYAQKLVESGHAFYCFTTKEELNEARRLAEANNEIFRFRSPYRNLSKAEAAKKVAAGEEYVIRLKTPANEEITFTDDLQGTMTFPTNEVDDTVLLKSDGYPTYHLAVVVDDYLMKVSHVFRAVEWIPSIPKTVLIYRAFGWDMPNFYHVPQILDPEGGKLSKRKGSVAAKDFLEKGYLVDAILNFLMLLGWSAPISRQHGESEREIFSLEEFVTMFELKDLNKSNAIFNRDKLKWFNQQYISHNSDKDLLIIFTDYLQKFQPESAHVFLKLNPQLQLVAITITKNRAVLLPDIFDQLSFLFTNPVKVDLSNFKQTKNLTPEEIKTIADNFKSFVEMYDEKLTDLNHDQWETRIRSIAEEMNLKAGMVFMALRIMTTMSSVSPPLFESMLLLGKKELINRLTLYL